MEEGGSGQTDAWMKRIGAGWRHPPRSPILGALAAGGGGGELKGAGHHVEKAGPAGLKEEPSVQWAEFN